MMEGPSAGPARGMSRAARSRCLVRRVPRRREFVWLDLEEQYLFTAPQAPRTSKGVRARTPMDPDEKGDRSFVRTSHVDWRSTFTNPTERKFENAEDIRNAALQVADEVAA